MAAKTRSKTEGTPKRRKTGESKRKATKAQGSTVPPDERKVKTGADAAVFWEGMGAHALRLGTVVRVSIAEDVGAFADIKKLIDAHAKEFAERLCSTVLVTGAAMVVTSLEKLAEGEAPAHEGAATDIEVEEAAALVGSVRDGIKRLEKGPKKAPVRHAFGIDKRIDPRRADLVLAAIDALLDGRRKKPDSLGARSIIPKDVTALHEAQAKLQKRVKKDRAEESATEIEHSRAAALQAGLELFYDRYAAAATRIFANDRMKRKAALTLVPRREERRGGGGPPAAGGGGTDTGGPPGTGGPPSTPT